MIEVRGLTKRYGAAVAVNHLDFTVVPGRVTGFLGPNGAGKSTTMRMLLGLEEPCSGTATIGGRRYADLRRPLHQVGALLDAKAAHPGRSAYHHLLALAQTNGIGRRRVLEVLGLVGLAEVARRPLGDFSLGMGQRLGIGAALLGNPQTLIFDEPVNGLDPEGILWIRWLMRSLAAEGRTVLVSSHLMSEMALTADHLVVIGRGRLIADTSTENFIASSCESWVQVRTPEPDRLKRALEGTGASVDALAAGVLVVTGLNAARIGELAASASCILHELTTQQASLEEAFIEMTSDSVDYRAEIVSAACVGVAA